MPWYAGSFDMLITKYFQFVKNDWLLFHNFIATEYAKTEQCMSTFSHKYKHIQHYYTNYFNLKVIIYTDDILKFYIVKELFLVCKETH
jgi:hypothetical protein